MQFGGINVMLILKATLTFIVIPWVCIHFLLMAFVPKDGSTHLWQTVSAALLVGAAYLVTPAAAAYFAATRAERRPLVHALLSVALGLILYLSIFDDSLLAVFFWPLIGTIGVLPVILKARTSS